MYFTPPRPAGPPDRKVRRAACVILRRPRWFRRRDFLDWRQGKHSQSPATWGPLCRSGEYCDVFVYFERLPSSGADDWAGSDTEGMPEDIYGDIGRALYELDARNGIVWIKPC
jgi:hypothetical protein